MDARLTTEWKKSEPQEAMPARKIGKTPANMAKRLKAAETVMSRRLSHAFPNKVNLGSEQE